MTDRRTHIIKNQIIEIEFHDRASDMSLPSQISEFIQSRLNEKLGLLLDEVALDTHLYIDKLSIDIGTLNSKNWENEFIDKALREIRIKILEEWSAAGGSIYQKEARNKPQSSDSVNNSLEKKASNIDRRSVSSLVSDLNNFLTSGTFSWKFSTISIAQFEETYISVLKEIQADFYEVQLEIYKTLVFSEYALTRLQNQFSSDFIAFLMGSLPMQEAYDDLQKANLSLNKNSFKEIQVLLVLWYGYQNKIIRITEFENAVIEKNIFKTIHSKLFKSNEETGLLINEQTVIEALMHLKSVDGDEKKETDKEIQSKVKKAINLEVKSEAKKDLLKDLEKSDFRNEYFISNSGLVLLHPYLPSFFNKLEYISENNEWKNEKSRIKAVLITEYLVSGEERFDEHKLILNKILCGMPLELPLESEFIPNENERLLSRQLLEAVISNWSALKNTSVEGLQNTFLKRNGKLEMKNDNWAMTVEQKAWDILLAQLPWGIGIVKSPWMDNLIHVSWG